MDALAVKNLFLDAASEWICDSCGVDIRYIAAKAGDELRVIDASFAIFPLPQGSESKDFFVDTGTIVAGQVQKHPVSKNELIDQITEAVNGSICIGDQKLQLVFETEPNYYSELLHRDSWFSELHLQVIGQQPPSFSALNVKKIDQALRTGTPPFDGLSDLCGWLHLSDINALGRAAALNIRVLPPVDLRIDQSSLSSNQLQVTLEAHPELDPHRISLALRIFPGVGIKSRKQVGDQIKWEARDNRAQVGTVNLELEHADSVLAMLTLGEITVRRQWIIDPDKAINPRYVATQLFDKDLKQLRQALFDSSDSVRFEQGVSSLLFILGFAPAIQVETQAPDILLQSPSGRLALVECTLKTADFQTKVGKLVDRRNALRKHFESIGSPHRLDAFLVCGTPEAQIAYRKEDLTKQEISLLSKENIEQAFNGIRTPQNPDQMLESAARRLSEALSIFER